MLRRLPLLAMSMLAAAAHADVPPPPPNPAQTFFLPAAIGMSALGLVAVVWIAIRKRARPPQQ